MNRDFRGAKGNSEVEFSAKGSNIENERTSQRSFDGKNFLSNQNPRRERERSPFREKGSRLDHFIKNHSKCIEINHLAIEVAAYSSFSSMCIAYILAKNVEAELRGILDSIKK